MKKILFAIGALTLALPLATTASAMPQASCDKLERDIEQTEDKLAHILQNPSDPRYEINRQNAEEKLARLHAEYILLGC